MDLQLVIRVLKSRFWLITHTVILAIAGAVAISLMATPMYRATADILIDFKEPTDSVSALPATLQDQYIGTQMQILVSRNVALKVVDKLLLAEGEAVEARFLEVTGGKGSIRQWLADGLVGGLSVRIKKSSRLVQISFSSQDPDYAATIANAFADAYIQTVLEFNVEPARKRAQWINDQLAELRDKFEGAQRRLTAYQQEKGVLATEDRQNVELAHLNALTNQLANAQAEAENIEGRVRQLEAMKGSGAALETLPEVLSNTYIQSLKADLRRKEQELADISSQYGDRHPTYLRARAEIRSLRSKLGDEIQAILKGLKNQAGSAKNREESLRKAQEAQKAKLLDLKLDALPALLRDVDNAQRNYDQALASYQQANLLSRLNQTNVTVLNPALEPLEAEGPNLKKSLILAAVMGFLLGCVLALLLEWGERRIRSGRDVVDAVDMPLLGTINRG